MVFIVLPLRPPRHRGSRPSKAGVTRAQVLMPPSIPWCHGEPRTQRLQGLLRRGGTPARDVLGLLGTSDSRPHACNTAALFYLILTLFYALSRLTVSSAQHLMVLFSSPSDLLHFLPSSYILSCLHSLSFLSLLGFSEKWRPFNKGTFLSM